jgi:glycerol transport system substrate-binding protein
MDSLAAAQDSVMERLEKSGVQGACGPKLHKKESAEFWFAKAQKDGTIAPQRKLANEKPKGETVDYDTLIKSWPATPPKRASLQ